MKDTKAGDLLFYVDQYLILSEWVVVEVWECDEGGTIIARSKIGVERVFISSDDELGTLFKSKFEADKFVLSKIDKNISDIEEEILKVRKEQLTPLYEAKERYSKMISDSGASSSSRGTAKISIKSNWIDEIKEKVLSGKVGANKGSLKRAYPLKDVDDAFDEMEKDGLIVKKEKGNGFELV